MAVPRITRRAPTAAASKAQDGGRPAAEFAGAARLGKRTKRLVRRLGAADIAIVDHVDLDRVSAEDLVASGGRCVGNAARSSSGRYPNQGPLVLAAGVGHQRDLRILRPYVRDVKPVLVAVDGGADAILDEGFVPDMIVGDMDSASDAALRSGAELVVHAYPDGRAPGRDRLDPTDLPYKVVPSPGTSEDVALL